MYNVHPYTGFTFDRFINYLKIKKEVYLLLLVTKFCENIPQNTFNILP